MNLVIIIVFNILAILQIFCVVKLINELKKIETKFNEEVLPTENYILEENKRKFLTLPESIEKARSNITKDAYSAHELAEVLGVHFTTVCNAARSGKLRAKKVNNRYLIKRADILAYKG